jgi:hypothetical protein
MNKDTKSIFETYKATSAKQEIIEEGIFDVLKTRGSEALGGAKGLGQQALGGAQKLAGKAVGKVGTKLGSKSAETIGGEIQKAGQRKITSGGMASDIAKYKTYLKSSVDTLLADLKGLDIKVKDENALRQALTDTIVQNLQNVTATGQYRSKTGALGGKIT